MSVWNLDKYAERLEAWADSIRRQDTLHHRADRPYGTGIEIVFDGLCEWSYQVKVKRPWRLFGEHTREVFLIYEKELRAPLATSILAAELVAAKVGRPISSALDEYVDAFNYDLTNPEDVGWVVGEDDPPDYPFSIFSWGQHVEQLSKLEGGSFVSRYIKGFEGKENELVYIDRLHKFAIYGEGDAELGRIFPAVSPRVSIDGVLIEVSETTDLLKLASELLPKEWI